MIAPVRADRPIAPPTAREGTGQTHCPFCPGNESETPPELFAIRDGSGWTVRVVPNRYPAVQSAAPAFGFHEVLIESARHLISPVELGDGDRANLFRVYRERLKHHATDPRIQSVSIFKNVGAQAGASLDHLHSQLVALPFVPDHLSARVRRGDPCPICTMLTESERIVGETEHFVAACPFAPRFPYEAWIVPKRHVPRYESTPDDEITELADMTHRLLCAYDYSLNRPAFNWILHSAPRGHEQGFHWTLELFPRLSRVAGFEWATGVFINDVVPEGAAAILRDKLPG